MLAPRPCTATAAGHSGWSRSRANTTRGEQPSSSFSRDRQRLSHTQRVPFGCPFQATHTSTKDVALVAMHAPRACEATAATTCAGGGLGPQLRVVSSPVPCSAAIGSDCHAPNAFLSVARFKLLTQAQRIAIVTMHALRVHVRLLLLPHALEVA